MPSISQISAPRVAVASADVRPDAASTAPVLVTPLAPSPPAQRQSALATPNTGGALRRTPNRVPITTTAADVIPTGNEIIALPNIRASDGAVMSFNVVSMRQHGLLEVSGGDTAPALRPYVKADGKELPAHDLTWDVAGYWVPTGHYTSNGLAVSYTYAAPSDEHGAFIRVKVTNQRSTPATVDLGMQAQWGALNRVIYSPVKLKGERVMAIEGADQAAFTFGEPGTESFAWTFNNYGAKAKPQAPASDGSVRYGAERTTTLQPGASAEQDFIIGVGVDQLSSGAAVGAVWQRLDRAGSDGLIRETAAWAQARTRTTGDAKLDTLMNRNYLFTRLFAWGRTLDTEQLVGVTSRSPRYYVSAAYWDRDAMLWSLPALIDTDPRAAREALNYALTTQLHNTGIHSRFIDGAALEQSFQLDEAAAPLAGLAAYVERTGDVAFLAEHRSALVYLQDMLYDRRDAATGLYTSLMDSQDEYERAQFLTYDNVLVWKTFGELAHLWDKLGDHAAAAKARKRARALKPAIMHKLVASGAPGASGPIFAMSSDGKTPNFADIPPGSLLLLPTLGFIKQDDPLFVRTYDWLHSHHYQYAFAGTPYGLPGSYRVPFTTSWSVADHMRLKRGAKKAFDVAVKSPWDAGIVTEGLSPTTAIPDQAGRAFATAAGYVAHAICDEKCTDKSAANRRAARR